MGRMSRLSTCLLMVLCVSLPASPFYSPLSDESIREAYFLGQRHDGSFPLILSKYVRNLPLPKSSPHISSVTFLTAFHPACGVLRRVHRQLQRAEGLARPS